MTDVRRLLERQAEWQKARRGLSWPEKIRMAEAMRDAIRQLRGEFDERRHAQATWRETGSPRSSGEKGARDDGAA